MAKRAAFHGSELDKSDWEYAFGESPLLDSASADWQPSSRMMRLFERYASSDLKDRAERLVGTPKFRDQIARKVRGALLLRDAVDQIRGNVPLALYSGWRTAIRCSDANPRQLIRIFNLLLLDAMKRGSGGRLGRVTPNVQSAELVRFSQNVLARAMSYPRHGPRIHAVVHGLGEFAREQLHSRPLQSDQVSAIAVDASIAASDWDAVKAAVGIGLLFPGTTPSHGDQMPERSGVFHLAYVLAPTFRVLPRRGKARSWQVVLQASKKADDVDLASARQEQLNLGLEHESE